jgi:hypothetical protein
LCKRILSLSLPLSLSSSLSLFLSLFSLEQAKMMQRMQLAKSTTTLVLATSTRSITTGHLFTRNSPLVEIITDSNDPRCAEVYRLRHDVLAKAAKSTVFTEDHPLVFPTELGFEIYDDLDQCASTTQYAVRGSDGNICCAVRYCFGCRFGCRPLKQ